jgi:hypothetical protein
MADLKNLKGVSEQDRRLIEEAEVLLGPSQEHGLREEPVLGNFREELVFPYPVVDADEAAVCEQLLARLDEYLKNRTPLD